MNKSQVIGMIKSLAGRGGASSWNDLQDKPFGEGVAVIYSGDMEMVDEDGLLGNMIEFPQENGLDVKKCRIKWNGTVYDCEQKINEDFHIIYFGNLGPMGLEDTGEPFVIQCSKDVWFVADMLATEANTVSLEITHDAIVRMPYAYACGAINFSTDYDSVDQQYLWAYGHRTTKEEFLNWLNSGATMWVSGALVTRYESHDEYVKVFAEANSNVAYYTAEYTIET